MTSAAKRRTSASFSAGAGSAAPSTCGEEPRRAHGAAREHDGRGAAVQQPQRRVPAVHVAGGDHGDGQLGGERERHRVVGVAFVELRRRARVDADGGRAGGDEPGRREAPELVAVPQPRADLHGDGDAAPLRGVVHGLHHGGDDAGGALGLGEQRRPGAGLDDLAHGAGHVEVDEVGAGGHRPPRRVGQHVGVGAEQLEPERVLVLPVGEVVERAPVVVVHAVGGDHLRVDEPGPPAAHAAPERRRREAGHGSHEEPPLERESAEGERLEERIGRGAGLGRQRAGRGHARGLRLAAGAASRSRCRAA